MTRGSALLLCPCNASAYKISVHGEVTVITATNQAGFEELQKVGTQNAKALLARLSSGPQQPADAAAPPADPEDVALLRPVQAQPGADGVLGTDAPAADGELDAAPAQVGFSAQVAMLFGFGTSASDGAGDDAAAAPREGRPGLRRLSSKYIEQNEVDDDALPDLPPIVHKKLENPSLPLEIEQKIE